MAHSLAHEHCEACHDEAEALDSTEASALVAGLNDWQLSADNTAISKQYGFKDYAAALAFVTAVSVLAEAENHHPDIAFGWGYAIITLSTHAVESLSRNDFILAAKIDALPA